MAAGFIDDFALRRQVSALRYPRYANPDAICI